MNMEDTLFLSHKPVKSLVLYSHLHTKPARTSKTHCPFVSLCVSLTGWELCCLTARRSEDLRFQLPLLLLLSLRSLVLGLRSSVLSAVFLKAPVRRSTALSDRPLVLREPPPRLEVSFSELFLTVFCCFSCCNLPHELLLLLVTRRYLPSEFSSSCFRKLLLMIPAGSVEAVRDILPSFAGGTLLSCGVDGGFAAGGAAAPAAPAPAAPARRPVTSSRPPDSDTRCDRLSDPRLPFSVMSTSLIPPVELPKVSAVQVSSTASLVQRYNTT